MMDERISIGVIGAGSWGTALANLLAAKEFDVMLWARTQQIAESINQTHQNSSYLISHCLHPKLKATTDLAQAVSKKSVLILVTPAHSLREVMLEALPHLSQNVLLVSCSKGIENKTLMTMHAVLQQVLPKSFHERLCFLSGPSFADEVIRKIPTAVTIASHSQKAAEEAQQLFFTDYFRTYSSNDVIGVELGGALKNVIAIAAGVADGLGFGHNSRAALITRGLGEIAKLGQKMGANPITFLGLAGMGDLILTCTSDLSRNRQVGMKLGQGLKLDAILKNMSMIAEGIYTAASVCDLSKRENVEMVICERIHDILYQGADPRKIVTEIMTRTLKAEFPWLK